MAKTALVVIDMLNDFVDGSLGTPSAQPIIDPIVELAKKAREHEDWVVIYANDAHRKGDFEFKVFGEHALVGTLGADVIPRLAPGVTDLVVPKRYYSAFTQTDLDATCRTQRIDRMVITGMHTNCCCRHTTYDAFVRGIDVAVVSDGTTVFQPMYGDRTADVHEESLDYLASYYEAEIMDASSVF